MDPTETLTERDLVLLYKQCLLLALNRVKARTGKLDDADRARVRKAVLVVFCRAMGVDPWRLN